MSIQSSSSRRLQSSTSSSTSAHPGMKDLRDKPTYMLDTYSVRRSTPHRTYCMLSPFLCEFFWLILFIKLCLCLRILICMCGSMEIPQLPLIYHWRVGFCYPVRRRKAWRLASESSMLGFQPYLCNLTSMYFFFSHSFGPYSLNAYLFQSIFFTTLDLSLCWCCKQNCRPRAALLRN